MTATTENGALTRGPSQPLFALPEATETEEALR
jgi:hypothetical protein